jgi:ectoine hydroxylase
LPQKVSFFQKIFERYTGLLRRLKLSYVLNNWLNVEKLRHNKVLYKRYGIKKSILSPIGSADFHKRTDKELPWLDRPDALDALVAHPLFQGFDADTQAQIEHFVREGYMVLEGFFPKTETDALNEAVDQLLETGQADFNYTGRKIFNLHEQSEVADRFFRNEKLLALLSFLLGKKVIPFQSLNFTLGSEQRAHSDSIHMTTEPPGYMIATWAALEDCSPLNGPLVYYPGSHRLPYMMAPDYDSGNAYFTIGAESNLRYEDAIAALIKSKNLEKQAFIAKRGDLLIWHANLLHGGSPILQEGATRRSMVCHYFCEDVICYHEMTQRPALIK